MEKKEEEKNTEEIKEETREEVKEETIEINVDDSEVTEEEASEDEETTEDGKKGDQKKTLFGKKKEKSDPMKEKLEELQDKCMRQMAEFENFRKRTDREKAQMFDTGAAHVIEKILPVVDNFERGLAAASDDEKKGAFGEGMDKIYRQMLKVMEELGVTPIEALGKEFDPNFHNAVMQTEGSEEFPSGTVAQEMQKGYMYHDTVIRHSMVAVAE